MVGTGALAVEHHAVGRATTSPGIIEKRAAEQVRQRDELLARAPGTGQPLPRRLPNGPAAPTWLPAGFRHQRFREKMRRKNRKTFRTSRKIDAASSGAESMSRTRRRRWKSNIVKPANTTSPSSA